MLTFGSICTPKLFYATLHFATAREWGGVGWVGDVIVRFDSHTHTEETLLRYATQCDACCVRRTCFLGPAEELNSSFRFPGVIQFFPRVWCVQVEKQHCYVEIPGSGQRTQFVFPKKVKPFKIVAFFTNVSHS